MRRVSLQLPVDRALGVSHLRLDPNRPDHEVDAVGGAEADLALMVEAGGGQRVADRQLERRLGAHPHARAAKHGDQRGCVGDHAATCC